MEGTSTHTADFFVDKRGAATLRKCRSIRKNGKLGFGTNSGSYEENSAEFDDFAVQRAQ
jgi:hypothetical protein